MKTTKYIMRYTTSGEVVIVLGLGYVEPEVSNKWLGEVFVGGARHWASEMRRVLGWFGLNHRIHRLGSESGMIFEKSGPSASSGGKLVLAARGLLPAEFKEKVKSLSSGSVEFQEVRSFRRLMY